MTDDKPREYCGVFGVWGVGNAAAHVVLGLHALQHRGQESVGIVSEYNGNFYSKKSLGLVGDNFTAPHKLKGLIGKNAIGHNRYSTTGESDVKNIQPLYADTSHGGIAIAHNGNFTNGVALRKSLTAEGALFHSTTDSEVILHLMARGRGDMAQKLETSLRQVHGAYALLCLTKDTLIGVRDPFGIRPLVLGQLHDDEGGGFLLASETVALDMVGAKFVRDVAAGEMIIIEKNRMTQKQIFPKIPNPRTCLFEYVYFARPDSVVDGISIYQVRKEMGRELARESPIKHDKNDAVVVPVPDSGVSAALGFSEESGIPFDLGIIRNHYVGRTFIEPAPKIRQLGVKLKHNANQVCLKDKRVVLVDDSLVRGTTAAKIVKLVKDAGAREVIMRVSSPPVKYPCYYGIDLPNPKELIASNMAVKVMAKQLGLADLAFLSLDGLYRAMGEVNGRDPKNPRFTDHYFTGDYPAPLTDKLIDKKQSTHHHLTDLSQVRG
ncbi:MAG: amidophosphoribosyltransferase [Alphaproteobacteria bacterium]